MNTSRRVTAVIGSLATAASLIVLSPPAQSEELAPSHVTVRSTDYTPASGQTFRLYGALWSGGERQAARIRVKTYRNGEWVRLPGAVMDTNRENRYRIRIILQMKGERLLRVIARPKDDSIAVARKTIEVTVH
ncbi:MAG TPA: hypothetical protein VFZ64_05255 [Nocardioidaceae bacterium]